MASTSDSGPIWARPEPGSRRPRFTRQQIAAAALAIADTEGFDAVSMRRIATELGAGTMTLYHYVRTKDDLVALMDDAIMAEVLLPDDALPRHWHPALWAISVRTWEVLTRHPWVQRSLQGARLGPHALRHSEQSLAAVADTDLSPVDRFALIGLVDDYVAGHALRAAETRDRATSEAELAAVARFVGEQLRTGRYPQLVAAFGGTDPAAAWTVLTGGVTERQRFERGLGVVLAGAAGHFGLPLPD